MSLYIAVHKYYHAHTLSFKSLSHFSWKQYSILDDLTGPEEALYNLSGQT